MTNRSIVDHVIDAGASLDWIGPLWSLVQDARHAPSVGFTVSANTCWSAYALQDVLNSNQIDHWGWAIYDQSIVFRVERQDATDVRSILAELGLL